VGSHLSVVLMLYVQAVYAERCLLTAAAASASLQGWCCTCMGARLWALLGQLPAKSAAASCIGSQQLVLRTAEVQVCVG
jgi:cytochrome bd-type quinol oxidase subunit 1